MLGCQDFCGYYDWTFHYLRRRFGQQAVDSLWSQAIAVDSQQHYTRAGQEKGLRGLYESWEQTGVDEQCDWAVTLDEEHNLMRIDMRQCPSKGFLIDHDLHAHEDYCDHCMGWIAPALDIAGMEITSHEHNHCGQCWWEIRKKGQPCPPVEVDTDIRKDPRWNQGFLDRYASHIKLPILDQNDSSDSCKVLIDWFAHAGPLVVLADGPSAADFGVRNERADAVILVDDIYADKRLFDGEPQGVLMGHHTSPLAKLAERFNSTPVDRRPLLMHTFLPNASKIDFSSHGLPRPIPILPLLIRAGIYVHRPNQPHPTTAEFAFLLAEALGKREPS